VSVSDEYIAFVRDQLRALGDLRVKRMFGGAGLYSNDTFFAILADDRLFLKVSDRTRGDYERRGLAPFSYQRKDGRKMVMGSYYPAPPEVIDDPVELCRWAEKAIEVAAGSPGQRA
jgi:DNA transformation protein